MSGGAAACYFYKKSLPVQTAPVNPKTKICWMINNKWPLKHYSITRKNSKIL